LTFFGFDGHGSVRFLTDSTGAVTDTYDYDAFGNLINSTGTTPNNYLFAGEQFDPALGVYYNRARYYDERSGRFWTMDKFEGGFFDPPSLHKYLYANANPISKVDPSGNETLGEVVQAASIYLRNVALNARAAFSAGSAAVGTFFVSIGIYAQNAARQIIQLFTTINSEQVYEEIEANVPVIFQNSRRVIDFFVRAKDGVSNLLIEVKYGLPRVSGPALSRLVGQITNAVGSGKAGQVVIWTLRSPSA